MGTRAQLAFLETRGCDCFQGFWVSPALPAADFIELARSRPAKPVLGLIHAVASSGD